MSDTTALTTPQDQVDSLISQVADENGLEISQKVGESKVPQAAPAQTEGVREAPLEEDGKLAERLRALRVRFYCGGFCVMLIGSLRSRSC
jgi:charged multivesicular body protein 1